MQHFPTPKKAKLTKKKFTPLNNSPKNDSKSISEVFLTEELKQNKYLRCLNCKQIPLLSLDPVDHKININCNEGHKMTENIKKYLRNGYKNDFKTDYCEECNAINTAIEHKYIYYCKECDKILCNICNRSHNELNHHTINYKKFDTVCINHKKSYNYFCFQCQKHLCEICLKNSHSDHDYIDLDDIIPKRKEIKKIKEDYQKEKENLDKISEFAKMLIENIENEINKILEYKHLELEFKKNMIITYENKIDNYSNIKNIKNLTFNTKPFEVNNASSVLDKLIIFFDYMKKTPHKDEKKDEIILVEEENYNNKIFEKSTKIPSSIVFNKKSKIFSCRKSNLENNYIEIKKIKNINKSSILNSESEYNPNKKLNKQLMRNKSTSYNYDLENSGIKKFNLKRYPNINLTKNNAGIKTFLDKFEEDYSNENINLFNSVQPKKITKLETPKTNIKEISRNLGEDYYHVEHQKSETGKKIVEKESSSTIDNISKDEKKENAPKKITKIKKLEKLPDEIENEEKLLKKTKTVTSETAKEKTKTKKLFKKKKLVKKGAKPKRLTTSKEINKNSPENNSENNPAVIKIVKTEINNENDDLDKLISNLEPQPKVKLNESYRHQKLISSRTIKRLTENNQTSAKDRKQEIIADPNYVKSNLSRFKDSSDAIIRFDQKFKNFSEKNVNINDNNKNDISNNVDVDNNENIFLNDGKTLNDFVLKNLHLKIKEIKNSIYSLIELNDNDFACGFLNGEIDIYDSYDSICLFTIKEHKARVNNMILLSDKKILTSSYDYTMKKININIPEKTYVVEFIFFSENYNMIYKNIELLNNNIMTILFGGNIFIWEKLSDTYYKNMKQIELNNQEIYDMLQLTNNDIVISTDDKNLKFYNNKYHNYSNIENLNFAKTRNNLKQVKENYLLVLLKNEIGIIDFDKKSLINKITIDVNFKCESLLLMDNKTLLVALSNNIGNENKCSVLLKQFEFVENGHLQFLTEKIDVIDKESERDYAKTTSIIELKNGIIVYGVSGVKNQDLIGYICILD